VASPAAQRIAAETGINPATVSGTGREGRVTKEDMTAAASHVGAATIPQPQSETSNLTYPNADSRSPSASMPRESPKAAAIPVPGRPPAVPVPPAPTIGGERREPMSKIRRKIAERLVAAQQTAAILTTFNEVDLSAVQDLRARYKERFNEVYGVGLGLMSFFVHSAVLALKEFPRINAFIDGNDVVYHDYVHMGIAVSTERGLAVPVLRNAHLMNSAQIESEIRRLATAARSGKLALDELSGGTFSITNGGVFGSLLSTPILNPPQSAILGMHAIQKRPVAIGDKVEVRPMMYIALSYDHRLVDGRESVTFLVRLKQYLEDPARLVLQI
jgi:2-oxoglutarate dehydrogenase E2 component (dihydrolipoamide succinyltransferase)